MPVKYCLLVASVALLLGCLSDPGVTSTAIATATPAASVLAPTTIDCPPEDELPTIVGTTGVPPPIPTVTVTAVPSSSAWLQLRSDLAALVDGYAVPGDYAVAVTDLQTGETLSVNGDRRQLAGCIVNLFVLMAATQELEDGRLSESAVTGLIGSTTWSSNATTAMEIVLALGEGDGVAGTQHVADYVGSLALDGEIILDHPPLYAEYSIGRDPNNWVTAEAMNEALVLLWEGEALSDAWRDFLLAHLEAVKPGLNYLVASVPARVSHKNGFFRASSGYVDNDTGIVRFLAGDREYAYAVTLLSQGVDIKYADVPLSQELMRTIHTYFTDTYR